MIGLICKVLKGVFVTGWICTASAEAVTAATYYVGPSGITSGTCTSDVAPYCSMDYGISKLTTAGDILEVHSGTYNTDRFLIRNKNGALGNHIIIQGYHYGEADAERPIIDGTGSSTWTQCVSPANVECSGLSGPLTDYWYTTRGKSLQAFYGTSKRGTYRVAAKSDMTNAHANWVPRSCTTATWIACANDGECPTGDTCSATLLPEVDSFSAGQACDCSTPGISYIVSRWCKNGASCQTPGNIVNQDNGYGFDIGTSSYLTIRGFYLRNFRRPAIAKDSSVAAPTALITLDDNIFSNSYDTGGSGYQIDLKGWPDVTISNSFFSHAMAESIHSEAALAGTKLTITGNYIRSNGDVGVLGPVGTLQAPWNGTPEGMTLGAGAGEHYDDSLIDNNYIHNVGKQGIIFENNFQGTVGHPITVSNNIINGTVRSGFKAACDEIDGAVTYLDFFNNIVLNSFSAGDAPVEMTQGISSCLFSHINFYNNTIIPRSGLGIRGNGAGFSTMVFRNNLFYLSGDLAGVSMVDLAATSSTNKFSNNLVYNTYSSPAIVKFRGNTFNCNSAPTLTGADLDGDSVADSNKCANPLLTDPSNNNYHPLVGSPAINMGTATGMPSTRTTSILNTTAFAHGFPSYDDTEVLSGSAWDAGATEFVPPPPVGFIQDGGFELGDFNLGGAESTSPCNDSPVGTGGRATVSSSIPTHTGTYAVKLEQYFIGTTCTPPALPGFKYTITNLNAGNTYYINGWIMNPTAIDTLYPLLVCMDDACSDTLPLGGMGLNQLGLCSGGTHAGNGCDGGLNLLEDCPGGSCQPRAGYYPFSSIFQARASTELLRFVVLSGNDSLYPRYIYLDDIDIVGSCILQ